jgi:hypothetical protein
MGGFRSFLILATGVAVGGALVIAHRISEENGMTMTEAFSEVPAEAQRIFTDVKGRAEEAVNKGRQAYDQKQAEMDAYLHGGGPAE